MKRLPWLTTIALLAIGGPPALAQAKYDAAASDTEIKIGTIAPLTGSFSEYGVNAKAEEAYFRMVNEHGGVKGRKLTLVTLDLGSETSRAPELARELVEKDRVLFTAGIWGTPANLAVRPYFNEQKVPQLFVAAIDSAFNDPARFPWTMGFQPDRATEATAYARYVLQTKPDAKIGVLCGSEPGEKQWLEGLQSALGPKASTMIVKIANFDYRSPESIDAAVATLQASGADTFMNFAVGRLATRAISHAYDLGWHPVEFIPNASVSAASFLDPAGREKCVGLICNARSKSWRRGEAADPAVRAFLDWMAQYNPGANLRDANYVYGYEVAQTVVEVLQQCGDDLTRANVLRQATRLDFEPGMLRPGIKVMTSPTDYRPIKQLYLIRYNGTEWESIGSVNGG